MYLFKYSIQNTFSEYFQHTFNMLLKQPCWSLRVLWVPSTSVVRIIAFVKGCDTNEECDWFNNFIFNFNSRNWWTFSFSVSGNEIAESDTSSVSLECLQYLEDKSTSLDCLHKLRQLGKCSLCTIWLYLHRHPWNVFFSYAGMVLTKKRGCMTDDTFEQQLLLKTNRHLLLK